MVRVLFIGLLVFNFSTVLADCQYSDGVKVVNIKEGQSVSLRSSGNSLETQKIKDQDSLSTCYANTTTTLLKAVLPSHPDLSYTHAAIMGTTRGWQENWSVPGKKYLNKPEAEENFTSGGWVCETIAGLKKAGGACPENLSITENKVLMDPDVQTRLFQGLGKYFDTMNSFKNDPGKMEQLKKDLTLAIEAIKNESDRLINLCEETKREKIPLDKAVTNLLSAFAYNSIAEPTACNEKILAAIRTAYTPESNLESDRFNIKIRPEVIEKFKMRLESDPDILKELEDHLPNYLDGVKNEAVLIKVYEGILTELLSLTKNQNLSEECLSNLVSLEDAESFIYTIGSSKNKSCANLLKPHNLNDLFDPSNSKVCMAPTNTDLILDAFRPLMEVGQTLDNSTINTLLNPESRYANQIVNALMPGCQDRAKLISLQDVSCSTFPFCNFDGWFSDSYTYSGPMNGCYDMAAAKRVMRMQTLNGITQGRATGIAVCTEFLYKPNIKTNFCRDPLPDGRKHGFHEMSLTGYRCKNSKIEYEVVNSWGTTCHDEASVECQKDEYGDNTGPFWVKEDILISNTTDITTVLKRKK